MLRDAYDRPIKGLELEERTTLDQVTEAFLRGLPYDAVRGAATVTEETAYMRQSWVYACVTAIARLVASIPVTVQSRVTGKPVPDSHPIAELFRRPAPRKSAYDFKFSLIAHYELAGNSLWATGGGKKNATSPFPLVPLNPRRVEPIISDRTGELLSYKYQPTDSARHIFFRPDELIHFKNFNPESEHWGMSPLTPAMHAIRTDVNAAIYNEKFFENNAQPGGILLHKKPLSRIQRDQVQSQFEEEYGGVNQSHRTAVLAGDWSYQQVGLGQADMEYLEQRRFSREQIAAVYGVPGLLINDPNNSNYSTASVEMRLFADANWLPKVRYIEDTLDAQFFAKYAPELTIVFETREAPGLREAISEQITQAIELNKAGVPLAELISAFRLPFDEHEWQKKWWIPISMVPADVAAASGLQQIKDDSSILKEKEQAEKKNAKEDDTESTDKDRAISHDAADSSTYEDREIYIDSYREILKRMTSQMERKMSRYMFELRGRVVRGDELDETYEVNEFKKLVAAQVGDILEKGGQSVFDELSRADAFYLEDQVDGLAYNRLVERLCKTPVVVLRKIQDTNSDAKEIIRGVTNKLKQLAHMEVAHVFNAGRLMGMASCGIKKHQWIASRSKGSCNHVNDGEVRDIGADFSNGIAYPAQDYRARCACLTLPVA